MDEVLDVVGLTDVADRVAGGFSLGMGQRLGIASALLGDPETIMLDEPVNGLDPEGILWIRHLLKDLAAEGRTVLVSSHLMSEMALTAEHFVIIGRGRLIADVSAAQLAAMSAGDRVYVRTPDGALLRQVLAADGVEVRNVDTAPSTTRRSVRSPSPRSSARWCSSSLGTAGRSRRSASVSSRRSWRPRPPGSRRRSSRR